MSLICGKNSFPMGASIRAFDEIADFFASKAPADLIDFRPSKATSDRVEHLIFKEKTEGLTPEEKHELDTFTVLEHIMRLAKAKARKHLS
jgi:hypothetical protein